MPPKRAAAADSGAVKKTRKATSNPVEGTVYSPDPADVKAVDTIRVLAVDVVEKAQSGHPGAPMGCAPIAYTLYKKIMKYNPANPKWVGRDRFVLSNGHACALQYIMMHLTGYESVSMDDLKSFRQLDSKTPGHPENHLTEGIEVSTGPLGQGISNAVGLAIAEAHLAAEFNQKDFPIFDNFTYVICGDGCLQEGVSSETGSLAGHLGLGKIIVLYDDNHITIDGDTSLSFTENVLMRYEAYGWHTSTVADVNNLPDLVLKIEEAKSIRDKPSIIKVRTIIAYGSEKQGNHSTHGAPLGPEDVKYVKKRFGFDVDATFVVPEDVAEGMKEVTAVGKDKEEEYNAMLEKYKKKHPKLYAELQRRLDGKLPEGWKKKLPAYSASDGAEATRKSSGAVLNALAAQMPELMGGSADLTPSNNTALKGATDFQKDNFGGRYMRFGVREHGMTSIANGMCAYGGLRPFIATFLNFVGYAWGALRLSALSEFGVLFIATHDSIGLGEDGPTHQPVELLQLLRATPNINAYRPADGNETVGSYICAMEAPHTPAVFCLSRQNLPQLEGSSAEKVAQGGYTLSEHGDGDDLDLILVGTGSETSLCVEAAKELAESGKKVRVVSMPCKDIFNKQKQDYKLEVFPDGAPVLSVEAASVEGWARYAHASHGMTTFGASGPIKPVMKKFGFTKEAVVAQAGKVIDFYDGKKAPSLVLVPQLD